MFKTLMTMLLVAAAFFAGTWYNERTGADPVSHAVHQAADQIQAVQQDLVARQRAVESRDAHRERMMDLFDRVLELIEQDMQHKQVAQDQQNH